MLFNVLMVILVLYVCATPYFYAKAIRFGMKVADKPEEAANEPIFHLPEKKQDMKMTPEQDRLAQVYANMLRYDGTAKGQKEIKVNG